MKTKTYGLKPSKGELPTGQGKEINQGKVGLDGKRRAPLSKDIGEAPVKEGTREEEER